jgi:hypothetical protein
MDHTAGGMEDVNNLDTAGKRVYGEGATIKRTGYEKAKQTIKTPFRRQASPCRRNLQGGFFRL